MQRPIPINEAEAIFWPLWDPAISPLSELRIDCAEPAGAKVSQIWCCVQVNWDRPRNGSIAKLSSHLNMHLGDHDRLMVFAGLPKHSRLIVLAQVDGKRQTIIDAGGADTEEEFTGPIQGGRLETLELEISSTSEGVGTVTLMWVGTASTAALARAAARREPYPADWPGKLLPATQRCDFTPQLGLFFGVEQLEALRVKAASPRYAPLMDAMRKDALESSRSHAPEDFVGTHVLRSEVVGADNFLRPADRRWTPVSVARNCAFVGLLDQDEQLMRYAARCALAMAHCEHWVGGPMEAFPGSRWHQRSFLEASYTFACLHVWDWAGGAITAAGRDFIRHAICTKALGRIQQDALEWEYVHHCNQGPYFFSAWLLALLAIRRQWPRAADMIPIVERYLCEALSSYVLDDGGSDEGPGYVLWTMTSLRSLWALSHDRKEAFDAYLKRVMPERFFKLTDYFRTMMSSDSAPPAGKSLVVGDAGSVHAPMDSALLMWLGTGASEWLAVFLDGLAAGFAQRQGLFSLGSPLLLALGPTAQQPPAPTVPVFHTLPVTGQLVSCRQASFGPVRLQLCGGKANAGHSHEDRGSFILEAAGDELAMDRGILTYSDPRCEQQSLASQHNLLLPVPADGSDPRQLNPCPNAVIPNGSGDDRRLDATVDATAAWNGLFKLHVRRVTSADPTQFVLTDEAEFEDPRAVSFNLHTRFSICQDEKGWLIAGPRASLRVLPRWPVASGEYFEHGVDLEGKPVNRLRLTATPAMRHRLVTELRVSASSR